MNTRHMCAECGSQPCVCHECGFAMKPAAQHRDFIYSAAILEATGRGSTMSPKYVPADHVPEASATLSQSTGLASGEPERCLSGDGHVYAPARHRAASRSSGGSGTPPGFDPSRKRYAFIKGDYEQFPDKIGVAIVQMTDEPKTGEVIDFRLCDSHMEAVAFMAIYDINGSGTPAQTSAPAHEGEGE